jgi:hypothetical protein
VRRLGLVVVAALGVACGSSRSTTAPTSSASPTPDGVVVISATGVNPLVLHALADYPVTFVNDDSRAHELRSDPHPAHTDCALLNVGTIGSGQSVQTEKLPASGCGYHDEGDPSNRAFQGFILAH